MPLIYQKSISDLSSPTDYFFKLRLAWSGYFVQINKLQILIFYNCCPKDKIGCYLYRIQAQQKKILFYNNTNNCSLN